MQNDRQKLESKGFFSLSYDVLELWRKTLKKGRADPPGPDRAKNLGIFALISLHCIAELRSHCF